MKIDRDELWLCPDCYMLAMTGDASGFDYYYGKHADEQLAKCEAGLEGLGPHLISNDDPEAGEGHEEFNTRTCDSCEWHGGGEWHRCATLTDKE